MRQLLESVGISLPQALAKASVEDFPEMITVDGSVLLAQEYGLARSVSVKDFPDRTGYESFVNHFHIPYEGTRASLDGLLARVAAGPVPWSKLATIRSSAGRPLRAAACNNAIESRPPDTASTNRRGAGA